MRFGLGRRRLWLIDGNRVRTRHTALTFEDVPSRDRRLAHVGVRSSVLWRTREKGRGIGRNRFRRLAQTEPYFR